MEDMVQLVDDEVRDFVTRVREQLRDLTPDEQQELTEGLEADLGELVGEHGTAALGDPAAYAAELRSAAGLGPHRPGRRGARTDAALLVTQGFDRANAWWQRRLARLPGDSRGFLHALQPAWWVFRAWLAVELLAVSKSGDVTLVPTVVSQELGLLLTVVAVVASVQVGRGVLWPGGSDGRRGVLTRVVLLGLNLFAVVATPYFLAAFPGHQYDEADGVSYAPGLAVDGNIVTNVFPYDAQGHPLVGVQLVDQDGHPLRVYRDPSVSKAWLNGATRLSSVFPLPTREYDDATATASGTYAIRTPLASLPPVTLAGFDASTLLTPGGPVATPTPAPGGETSTSPAPTPTPTPTPAPTPTPTR